MEIVKLLGPALTILGAVLAALLPGIGSSRGVGSAGEGALGIVEDDPKKFGKLIILQALPGTQGIYGLLCFFMIIVQSGVGTGAEIGVAKGLLYLMAALPIAFVGYYSAIYQGRVAEAGMALLSKRPNELIKGIIMSAMVETYAILALLTTIMAISNIS